ncbi:MAG TPA: hypothetical protein VGU61_16170 [Noviherbaspirillum sp.]|uniref:hypothetical protein n=1 Tax=Noviherbaspirillum sp. TaxID=1926288 RepID=UPI002DDDB72B|nr:hypothetical protein [Noviherbaspirillum sp.]HEV2611804.1 hypothetical protein [Noviherbaspirillum sp.]
MKTRKTITIDGTIHELSDSFLAQILETAVDGACSYWADVSAEDVSDSADPDGARDYDLSDYIEGDDSGGDRPFYSAASFLVSNDTTQGGTLDLVGIADAIERIAGGEVEVAPAIREIIITAVREDDASDIDAEAADCIIQVGLFDEIVYR